MSQGVYQHLSHGLCLIFTHEAEHFHRLPCRLQGRGQTLDLLTCSCCLLTPLLTRGLPPLCVPQLNTELFLSSSQKTPIVPSTPVSPHPHHPRYDSRHGGICVHRRQHSGHCSAPWPHGCLHNRCIVRQHTVPHKPLEAFHLPSHGMPCAICRTLCTGSFFVCSGIPYPWKLCYLANTSPSLNPAGNSGGGQSRSPQAYQT